MRRFIPTRVRILIHLLTRPNLRGTSTRTLGRRMRQSNLVALEEQLRAMHKAGLLILEHDSSGPTNRWSPTPIVEKAILNLASPNPIPLVPDYEFGCFPGNIQPLRDWLQSKGQAP